MMINIVLSLIITWKLGMSGCLIATIIALLYRINAMVIYTSKYILERSCLKSFKKILVNTAVAVGVLVLIGTESCEAVSYFYVMWRAIMNSFWIAGLFLVANLVTDFGEYKGLFDSVRARF